MSSTLKVLVDVGTGKAVEDWLRGAGYDTTAVRDIDPRMHDADILALAVSEQRLLLTMDKDFGELVYHSGQVHAGVLLLRLEEARGDEKAKVVEEIFTKYGNQLHGHFSVYQSGRLRVR
jgi:predicted nuclease of predicted toxin-antitoxin system